MTFLALAIVLFFLWAIAWPHVRLSAQSRRLAEVERRLAQAEEALILALEGAPPGEAPAPQPERAPPQAEAAAPAPPLAADEIAAAAPAPGPAPEEAAPPPADEPAPAEPAADWRAGWPKPAVAPRSLEERLGANWSVLIGGAALALGVLLLVRYSFEAGLIGPGARVLGGVLIGAALIAGGEWTRRRDMPGFGRISISATLTAAGAAALFGAIYAAHALYGFIGTPTAFLLLGATGLAAMATAALHGPMLAGLGLIGASLTPLLVESREPAPWTLAMYLLIVSASAYGLARLRRWWGIALGAAGAAGLWQLAFALGGAESFADAGAAHGLAQVALALAAFVAPFRDREATRGEAAQALGAPLALAALTLLTLVGGRAGAGVDGIYVAEALALVALLAFGGWLAPIAAALTPAAGVAAALVLWVWPPEALSSHDGHVVRALIMAPDAAPLFLKFAVAASAVVAAAGFLRLWRGETPTLPAALLGAAGAATPTGLLALSYARITGLGESGAFAMAAGALALAFTLIAAAFRPRAEAEEAARQGLGFAATGALATLAVGLSAALSGGSLTAAWGLSALAAAFVAARLDVAALRWGVAALGGVVALRLAWEPRVMREIGATPVFNWLLFGYGVPALAFAGAARLMREREDLPLQIARACALALAGFLVFFEIRHAMNGGDIYAHGARLAETGLHAFSATMFALGLTIVGGAHPPAVYRWATGIAGALAGLAAALGLFLSANPLFTGDSIGEGRFVNALIPGYLLPALGATALAVAARGRGEAKARLAAVAALLLLFAFVTLATRAQFHDFDLHWRRGATQAESFAYSGVWLALGLAALAYGVARRSKDARLGSAALVTLATLKVFLFDLAGLTGAWRAFSFIGLGLALIGIGAVYQRLLFPRQADAPGGEEV